MMKEINYSPEEGILPDAGDINYDVVQEVINMDNSDEDENENINYNNNDNNFFKEFDLNNKNNDTWNIIYKANNCFGN